MHFSFYPIPSIKIKIAVTPAFALELLDSLAMVVDSDSQDLLCRKTKASKGLVTCYSWNIQSIDS